MCVYSVHQQKCCLTEFWGFRSNLVAFPAPRAREREEERPWERGWFGSLILLLCVRLFVPIVGKKKRAFTNMTAERLGKKDNYNIASKVTQFQTSKSSAWSKILRTHANNEMKQLKCISVRFQYYKTIGLWLAILSRVMNALESC